MRDEYTFDHVFGGKAMKEANTFSGKLRSRSAATRSHLLSTKRRIIRLFTDPVGLFSSFYRRILEFNT